MGRTQTYLRSAGGNYRKSCSQSHERACKEYERLMYDGIGSPRPRHDDLSDFESQLVADNRHGTGLA